MAASSASASTLCIYRLRNFEFRNGTTLPSVHLAYLDINPQSPRTALINTAFRGRLNSTCTFANGALRNHRIIVVALFGNGESASPSNTDGFPGEVDYTDCVRAQHELLTSHLHIDHVDVALGFSMGGQCTYYWTLMHPRYVRRAVIICSSARTSRHNYQFLEGPKAALLHSVDYHGRDARESAGPSRGLCAFGKAYSAWLTSAEWFEEEMYRSLGYATLADWDQATTAANYVGWDPNDLLCKLGMWQRGDVTAIPGSGSARLEDALAGIEAQVLLMPCRTDQYFRWEASERESRMIARARFRPIPSIWGHLAGVGINKDDTEWMDQNIAEFIG